MTIAMRMARTPSDTLKATHDGTPRAMKSPTKNVNAIAPPLNQCRAGSLPNGGSSNTVDRRRKSSGATTQVVGG